MKVIWSRDAEQNAAEIRAHIARDDSGAAQRWLKRLDASVQRLGRFPYSGKASPEPDLDGVRELAVGTYRVFYEVDSEIRILAVLHARRAVDPEAIRRH